jgi:hypothetical protein
MTKRVGGQARGKRLPARLQWGGTLVAVAASLAALSLPGAARAATGTNNYDQMTGVGQTASAVTVNWTQGLLNDTNTAITGTTGVGTNADRTNQSSTLWFMYSEFQNLSVTVSQTQDIGHQGITVSWNWTQGGKPVATAQNGGFQSDFLQMMECYGDATTGPTPSQCEYGSTGLLPSGVPNAGIGGRTGPLCPAGAVAEPPTGIRAADGSPGTYGCDPLEGNIASDVAPCPSGTTCGPATEFDVPFVPVGDPTNPDYTIGDTTYYSSFTTNEVQEALVANGAGQQQFETVTGVQAPGLGCGLAESGGSVRSCWLVIVPRGTYEPNGFQVDPNSGQAGELIETSPLSQSNWDQRIQIHLTYSPVGSFCAPGTTEIQTFGTQLVQRAMQSWQLALNQAGNCKQVYAYSAVPESTVTQTLSGGGDVGLAFTTIPIGSEAVRDGGTAPTGLPTILYAPVAVAALDFGFNINLGTTGSVSTPVKLSPMLMAKALTQSYQQDLPDFFPTYGQEGPAWAKNNPLNISADPQFQTLNPEVPEDPSGPIALLLTEDHSAANQQVWQWINADSTASGWLDGTPDSTEPNVQVNPDYKALNLGQAAIDSYPRAYTGDLYYCPPTGPAASGLATASASSAASSSGTSTTTTLTVTPVMAEAGQSVTLTATEVAADKTNPAGSVQFEAAGTKIGTPVAVNASGAATTTTTLPSASSVALSAVFTPASPSYNPSTVTYTDAPCAQAVGTKDTTDLLPYSDNFDSAASAVITGSNTDLSGGWDLTIESPQNIPGWWDKHGVEPLGQILMWAADDTPDLAAYGLVPAQLCNDSGSSCISPSVASVTAAVSAATADSSGLLHVNPASPGTNAYPLTDIVYAAVATNQSPAALTDYAALISDAVGAGQTPGTAPGDLPPGYLPLPSNLVTQAQAVVTQLQNLASPSPSPSASSSTSASASTSTTSSTQTAASTATTAAGSTTTGTGTTTTTTTGGSTPTPTPAAAATTAPATTPASTPVTPVTSLGKVPVTGSTQPAGTVTALALPTPQDYVTSLPPNQAAAGTTPQQPVGSIRWVLLGLALVGGVFAGGGTLLRSGGIPPWRRRTVPP